MGRQIGDPKLPSPISIIAHEIGQGATRVSGPFSAGPRGPNSFGLGLISRHNLQGIRGDLGLRSGPQFWARRKRKQRKLQKIRRRQFGIDLNTSFSEG